MGSQGAAQNRPVARGRAEVRHRGVPLRQPAVLAIILVIADFGWLLPIAIIGMVLAGGAGKAAMPLITRFLDSLGETLPG